ncbi:hypothetical protein SAMN05192553_101118 [Cyclobacterium xiamenense]|uniref:Uncharacterized protein n=1 Tax=Cyclobacterium xiamenense TaxID=1297121 RepID=A0A1H6TEA6_9BACT|nr:hypothetical protein [Cyclobacterium xiamenense]SEI75417.1 hypothetical protein SAMN05192553_101118 [Cyclobacterium xiamenense]
MKKSILLFVAFFPFSLSGFSQISTEQLALDVSKVDAENTEKLKEYIWKLHADVFGEGENKITLISEFKYDDSGALNINLVGGETTIQKKPGVRGKMQQNAIESKAEYIEKAMQYALSYTYMTKGQLLDFFDKAEVIEQNGVLIAKGKDIYVAGDELIIYIDAETKRYVSKSFSTKMNADPISGEVRYDTFKSSGVNHITTTKLDLPVENVKIEGQNKDYTIRVD